MSAGPVSYTHLDVYKRQGTERENLAGDAKGKGASGSNREAESTDAPERGGPVSYTHLDVYKRQPRSRGR